MQSLSFKSEQKYLSQGCAFVAGCDEAGRGPLAGPVVAAACILDPKLIDNNLKNAWHSRVRDSKVMSEKEREEILPKILENSVDYGVGIVWQEEIDKINIHNASLLAMRKAVEGLKIKDGNVFVLVDGRFEIPNLLHAQRAVIKGDSTVLSIAASSIIAKVYRDNIMRELHAKFPEYGFAKHKGYGTKEHQLALKKYGMSVVHRKTFVKI